MQIIPKYHYAKLLRYGGEKAVLDPESNILVGTRDGRARPARSRGALRKAGLSISK